MRRRTKKPVKLNDLESMETMTNEVYLDACQQIVEAKEIIRVLETGATPSEISDLALIAKEKTNALKVKDSAIKMKMDISKFMREVIKMEKVVASESTENANTAITGGEEFKDNSVFDAIREAIEQEKLEKEKQDKLANGK